MSYSKSVEHISFCFTRTEINIKLQEKLATVKKKQPKKGPKFWNLVTAIPSEGDEDSKSNAEREWMKLMRRVYMQLINIFALKMKKVGTCKGQFKWQLHCGTVIFEKVTQGLKYFVLNWESQCKKNTFHSTQHETTFNELNLFSSFLLTIYSVPSLKGRGVLYSTPTTWEKVV